MRMWSVLCFTALLLCVLAAGRPVLADYAAGDTLDVYAVEEVVIEATRLAVPYTGLPFSAEVLTARDIAVSDANSPTDAAGGLPGVFVQKTGDFGRSDVAIRGLGNNGRQVMVMDLDKYTQAGINPQGTPNKYKIPVKDIARKGYIGLQDHGLPVWFKNVKFTTLDK